MKNKKYILISKDLQKNLIEFLDEIQFEYASNTDSDSMQIVNFCGWAIKELSNGFDAHFTSKKKPQPKSRDQYLDETFMDWNLPEMSDEEYEKLVDQFDAFLRGWEKEYNKQHPKKKQIKERPYKPSISDVAEHCTLDEIEEMLKDDPELSDYERFELYYEEHKRVQKEKDRKKEKRNSKSLKQIMKELNIKSSTKK